MKITVHTKNTAIGATMMHKAAFYLIFQHFLCNKIPYLIDDKSAKQLLTD